jgi:hypothetical protein
MERFTTNDELVGPRPPGLRGLSASRPLPRPALPRKNSSIGIGSEQANHSASVMASLLAQEQVHDPAPSHMLARRAAVGQHVGVVTPSFVKGIGQLRHPVEGSVVLDRAGQSRHSGRQPSGIDSHRAEGVAENITEDAALVCLCFSPLALPVHEACHSVHGTPDCDGRGCPRRSTPNSAANPSTVIFV